jgi:hypothetical protein
MQGGVSTDVTHLGKMMPSIKDYSIFPKIVTNIKLAELPTVGSNTSYFTKFVDSTNPIYRTRS